MSQSQEFGERQPPQIDWEVLRKSAWAAHVHIEKLRTAIPFGRAHDCLRALSAAQEALAAAQGALDGLPVSAPRLPLSAGKWPPR